MYSILETGLVDEMHLLLVNARSMKNVPIKKADMCDAEWIASLLRAGLLKGSFIPERDIRDLRQYTRYRKAIIRDTTSQKNRIEKLLQSSGFCLPSFLSDIFGSSGIAIMQHFVQVGFISEQSLANCLKGPARQKYLSGWYWRLKQRTDSKRAIVALARKLFVIIYAMLKNNQPFDE